MAEERLIDDDKDRKYKIRINEDGEEELVIDDTPDEDESDIPVFQIPVYDEDDEDATSLSPQEFAEREKRKKEEQEVRESKYKKYFFHRVKRLYPVYILIVFGAFFCNAIVNQTMAVKDLMYQATFLQNFYWMYTGYSSQLVPLTAHTWTMSIEIVFFNMDCSI